MSDHYLDNSQALNGQPKRTIAKYVEQNGVLVPKRFDSLEQGKEKGVPIIARSEIDLEYLRLSGMLLSLDTTLDRYANRSESELLNIVRKQSAQFRRFCTLSGEDHANLAKEVTLSFWELHDGYNRIVIADSAIKGRYHIMTSKPRKIFYNYTIHDKERDQSFIQDLPKELAGDITNFN